MDPSSLFKLILVILLIPSIMSETFDISIKENIPENKLISDLSAFIQYGTDLSKNKQFNLISESKANSLFILNTDGKLYSSKIIDREQLCSQIDACCTNKEACSFPILVGVSSPLMNSPSTFACRILVEDENDNVPKFEQSNFTIRILESEPVGSLFKLPLANDLDSEKFSVRQYKLNDDPLSSPMFSLEQSRSGNFQNLQLIQRLDREKKSSYQLTLLALDGGNPPLTGKLLIDIKVIDVNDNPPSLSRTNYKTTLKESVFLTESILTIEADDVDEYENAELNFKIIDDTLVQRNANTYFRIEQATGKIFLNEKLDYEKQEKYRFFVEVSNKNGHVDTATATVIIDVENLNDEYPEISISYLSYFNKDKDKAIIQENDTRTKFVALATVTDKDKGIGGQVTCKLNNYEDTFEIQIKDTNQPTNQYIIQTKVSLDRESVAFYKVVMECEDRGDPVLRTKKEIAIVVKDVNDNDPIVTVERNLSIKENSPKRTVITKIRAVDDDVGENGEFSFSISDSEDQTQRLLEIDPVSGELRTKEVIDREANIDPIKSLAVHLVVSDKGQNPRSTISKFTVNIDDENDNPPQFSNDFMEFSVTENQQPKYTLGEILVSDRDDESKLNVRLVTSSDSHLSPFIVYKKDNHFFLNTTRSLDWEKEKSFHLDVIASDGTGFRSNTVTAKIRVIVNDENDNSPLIIFPSTKNFTTPKVSMWEQIGFTVITISATDRDSSDTNNGKISYQITDNRGLFMIDSSSGTISTTRLMTSSDCGQINVRVIVRDFGSPSRETYLNLLIEVDDSKPHLQSEGHKDNEYSGKYSQNSYLWKKEGFLVICLVILLLFLLICVFIVLYMRHIRGLFPTLPDIFISCRKTSKNRKGSKSGSCGKFAGHIPFDENQKNSPLNSQQTSQSQLEKSLPPFYLNQYDSSANSVTYPSDPHFPVNPYRQYETLKYQQYSGPNVVPNMAHNSGTCSYDMLFYSSSTPVGEPNIHVPCPNLNTNHSYDGRSHSIPSPINSHLLPCRRIINNIDSSPLIADNFGDPRETSEPCPKFDDAEKCTADQYVSGTLNPRGHARPGEKIDTYAITYPLEQSTFV